jgi:glycine oxidase
VKAYDVVIVGGGIVGGSIAFEAARRNLRVALLDRQQFMQEASWAAAGILSPAPDCPAAIPLVPLGLASLALYPEFISAIEAASSVPTGFRTDGTIQVLCHGDADRELSTLVALHHGLGIACEPLPLDEAFELEPQLDRDVRAVAFLPEEASVIPRDLAAATLAAAAALGVTLISEAEVVALGREGRRCTGVKTSAGDLFSAQHVVLAAGCWTSLIPGANSYAPTIPVRGQMIALRHRGKPICRVLRSERGYIVPRSRTSPQILVTGSTIENAGYEKRVTSGGIQQILDAANEIVPELAEADFVDSWCGLRPCTSDQLPILGPTDVEGLTIATGHYRNGILLAPMTAKLIADWVIERKISFDFETFSPLRFERGNPERPEFTT